MCMGMDRIGPRTTHLPEPTVGAGVGRDASMVGIGNGVSVVESKVPGDILTLEVAPGLGGGNLSPHVHLAVVHGLLGRDPVVGTSAEAHALVPGLLSVLVVEVVWEEVVGLIGQTGDVP